MSEVIVRYGSIDGELKAPAANEPRRFTTLRIDQELADWLREKEVIVTGARSESWIGAVASWVLPLLLFYLISSFAFRRLGGGGLAGYLSVGKSRAKLYVETKSKVTFDDVASVDEARRELAEVVAFLKDPASFGRLGARAPKGTLLIGPQAPARRCSPVLLRERPAFPSSRSQARNSWRCS